MQPEFFTFQTTDARIAEKVVDRPDRWSLLVAHVVLPPGEAMPPHPTRTASFLVRTAPQRGICAALVTKTVRRLCMSTYVFGIIHCCTAT